MLLLFFVFTDYSWIGRYPDLVFGPLVGIVAIVSTLILRASRVLVHQRAYLLGLVPSLIAGGVALLLAIIIWIPPFTLGAIFLLDEVVNERVIQRAASPDGDRMATVTFRGVGAYDSGNGRVSVQVTHRLLPFVEHEVFYEDRSYASGNAQTYVRWKDDQLIEVIGEPDKEPVTVSAVWWPF
jgi:hypothetical protein